MITRSVLLPQHRVLIGEDFPTLITELEAAFPDWRWKDRGSLKTKPRSRHYHITSGKRGERGTLELTWDPRASLEVILKVAENRATSWSLAALEQLADYLGKTRLES